jgi:hypothetical protein
MCGLFLYKEKCSPLCITTLFLYFFFLITYYYSYTTSFYYNYHYLVYHLYPSSTTTIILIQFLYLSTYNHIINDCIMNLLSSSNVFNNIKYTPFTTRCVLCLQHALQHVQYVTNNLLYSTTRVSQIPSLFVLCI